MREVDTPPVTTQILREEGRFAWYSQEFLSQTLNSKFKTHISSFMSLPGFSEAVQVNISQILPSEPPTTLLSVFLLFVT